jgi:hypothetical protein
MNHLLLHVYPVVGPAWRDAIDRVRKARHLFTGRRAIAVLWDRTRSGVRLEDPEVVHEYAGDLFTDHLDVQNDPSLREGASWPHLWERVLPFVQPTDAVLFAHAKGVTRAAPLMQEWTRTMWDSLVSPRVFEMLKTHPIVGAIKADGPSHIAGCHWHYPGTFFWVRGDAMGRLAVPPPRVWLGVEAWPGIAFESHEAGAVVGSWPMPLDLYDEATWRAQIRPVRDSIA